MKLVQTIRVAQNCLSRLLRTKPEWSGKALTREEAWRQSTRKYRVEGAKQTARSITAFRAFR
jgi:hypothetical protein